MVETNPNEIVVVKSENSKINTVDFDNLTFGRVFTDHMFICDFEDGKWSELYWWIEEDFRTLRELDLVDMRTADKELLDSIEKEGVVLYER